MRVMDRGEGGIIGALHRLDPPLERGRTMTSRPRSANLRSLAIAGIAASLLACESGCVDASAHEKTASQLDAVTRTLQYKDQQMSALSWQVAMLSYLLRDTQMKSDAALRDLGPRVEQMSQANAACAE